jgi:hypothetical protein
MSLLLKSAASGEIRDNHYVLNPVTSLYERTTLLEAARTNAWTYSEDLSNAVWTKTRCSISANATTAPDGAATMDKVVEDSSAANSHQVQRTIAGTTNSTAQTFSFYAKAAERTFVAGRSIDKAGTSVLSYFNLGTGAVASTGAGHTVRIVDVGGGIYRCAVTFNTNTGGTTPSAIVCLATGDGGYVYSGDGTSGAYVWGLQAEVDRACASSYIPTAGSTATRNADAAYLDFTASPQEMTAYCRFFEQGTSKIANGSARLWQIGGASGTTDPRLFVFAHSTGAYRADHDNGTTEVLSLAPAVPALGDLVELRVVLGADGSVTLGQSIKGATEGVGATSAANALQSAWGGSRFYVNSADDTTGHGINAFAQVYVWAGTKTLAECRTMAGVS